MSQEIEQQTKTVKCALVIGTVNLMPTLLGIASIATRASSLRTTLQSLYTQVDKAVIYLNDYDEVPIWASDFNRVEFILGSKALGDLGDKAKFYALNYLEPNTYFFSADDDILYPPNYVEYTSQWLKYTQGSCLISYHGRSFKKQPTPPITASTYYSQTTVHHFNHALRTPQFVHFGGTGVMAFDSSTIKLALSDIGEARNMADIWVGTYAQSHKHPILLPPHKSNWLRQNPLANSTTSIFNSTKKATPLTPLNNYLANQEFKLITQKLNL